MKRWLRATRTAALGLLLPAMLASCGSGGGGGSVRLFFGTNGDGGCDEVVVEVDLEAAGAVLARRDDQSADCALGALLDTAGCEIAVEEVDGGDTLRVTIDDCTIPPIAALFECGFSEADLSEFDDVAIADCDCETSGCDQTPPVCVSGDDDPRSCEDCDNGQDDDLNGLEDCEDPNCEHAAVCGETPTTTLPDTTTTTAPDTTTTTTTLPVDGCLVTFRLEDDVSVGSLQWLTAYGEAGGTFANTGENVECHTLVSEALSAINERSAEETLEVGLISVGGIDGPIDLVSCTWIAAVEPDPADFVVSDIEAATVEAELLPDPEIGVHVDCDGTPPTTTTTTLPDTTTTTTLVSATKSKVLFKLTSASTTLGALQLAIDYSSAPGEFDGEDAAVKCSNKVPDALTARKDDDAKDELNLGFVSVDGFSAPLDLSECDFTGSVPAPEDFVITIEDAADIESEPATAVVDVVVTVMPVP
jgi:hypothetical protein